MARSDDMEFLILSTLCLRLISLLHSSTSLRILTSPSLSSFGRNESLMVASLEDWRSHKNKGHELILSKCSKLKFLANTVDFAPISHCQGRPFSPLWGNCSVYWARRSEVQTCLIKSRQFDGKISHVGSMTWCSRQTTYELKLIASEGEGGLWQHRFGINLRSGRTKQEKFHLLQDQR